MKPKETGAVQKPLEKALTGLEQKKQELEPEKTIEHIQKRSKGIRR